MRKYRNVIYPVGEEHIGDPHDKLDGEDTQYEISSKLTKFLKAEEVAFMKAGQQTGRVEFMCPLCGGSSVSARSFHNGSIHDLGGNCSSCGFSYALMNGRDSNEA